MQNQLRLNSDIDPVLKIKEHYTYLRDKWQNAVASSFDSLFEKIEPFLVERDLVKLKIYQLKQKPQHQVRDENIMILQKELADIEEKINIILEK